MDLSGRLVLLKPSEKGGGLSYIYLRDVIYFLGGGGSHVPVNKIDIFKLHDLMHGKIA